MKKKRMVLTLIAALTMTAAMAQSSNCSHGDDHGAPQGMFVQQLTSQLMEKLGLSTAQQKKVKKLNEDYADIFKMPAEGPGGQGCPGGAPQGKPSQRPDHDGNSSAKGQRPELTDSQKAEMKANRTKREEYQKKLKAILSDSQYQSYQSMQPQRQGRPNKD